MDAKFLLFVLLPSLLGLVLAKAVLQLLDWWRAKRILAHLPSPKGHVILGHLPVLVAFDHHKALQRWANDLGHNFYIRLLWQHVRMLKVTSFFERIFSQEVPQFCWFLEREKTVLLSR